jgi:hypothetical protein
VSRGVEKSRSREVEDGLILPHELGGARTFQTPDETTKQPTDLLSICQEPSLDIAGNQPDISCNDEESLQLA